MKKRRILTWCLAIIMLLTLFAGATQAYADDSTIEIKNFTELMRWVKLSKTESCQEYTFKLMNDIEITEENLQALSSGDYDVGNIKVRSVTFGQKNKKFGGVFDGQGHKIVGLEYDEKVGYLSDTGLFSYTDGATIKNLVIENANIDADYRGGFIAGSADNTTFENIIVKDSYMRVSCSNNVLTLATDGGLSGGAIAGEAVNCVLYNCESNNNVINNNNTSGVQALGGKGLYLGGLVGTADKGTLIEYSRVIGGEVKSHYDVAAGALGGNTLYVGGIVGEMQAGSKVMDCFATPHLYFYTATYVSVGAGNTGRIGGIAAAAYGNSCEIERCHFAGTAESKQYNAVLVIPIIEKNKNIYGLVDNIPDKLTVKESYVKGSNLSNAKAIRENKVKDGSTGYGIKDDATYEDRTFWEAKGYDFAGNITRETKFTETHSNKWVMDHEQGIPVHGYSVAATFDFLGAGSVSIGPTELINTTVSTSDAYNFAVQGIHPGTIELGLDFNIALNEGYHFYGWYKTDDYLQGSVKNIRELEAISHDDTNKVSEDILFKYKYALGETSDANNDLFVACVKADVTFYEVNGSTVINERDYTYQERLDYVEPLHIDGYKFYGWTTIPSSTGGGYKGITSKELTDIASAGELYNADEPVEKTMKLYPIYTDYMANIKTVFEGHEQDDAAVDYKRVGVGTTNVKTDSNDEVFIEAVAEDGTTNFPDGYRFLGWYEIQEDGSEVLVSTDEKYYVPDLTKEHTYIARFEYRVDYYSNTKGDVNGNIDKSPFSSIWYTYEEPFKEIKDAPLDAGDTFSHWATAANTKECSDCSNKITSAHKIVEPKKVYAHTTGSSAYDILITSDFPGSSVLSTEKSPANRKFTIKCDVNEGYNFIFWAHECYDAIYRKDLGTNPTWKIGYHLTNWIYHYEAHLNANVVFHDKAGNQHKTTRVYQENIFLGEDVTHTYKYPLKGEDIPVDGKYKSDSIASPTNASMKQEGYAFLGWISDTEIEVDNDTWNYIYDVDGDSYCTSDVTKALPYIMSGNEVCTQPMNLYPVYAKYNVKTTTNIEEMELPSGMNRPSIPTYAPAVITTIDDKTGKATITLTAEHDTTSVEENGIERYQLVGFTCKVDGVESDIFEKGNLSGDGKSYVFDNVEVQAGKNYLFTAIYEPIYVIYHLDNTDEKRVILNPGDILGHQPEPNYERIDGIENACFVGWTDVIPEGSKSQWIFDNTTKYEEKGLPLFTSQTEIFESKNLYPIFVNIDVTVDSNIDDLIDNEEDIRYVEKKENKFSLVAKKYPGYVFKGWYTGYEQASQNKVTEKKEYQLTEKDLFDSTHYTAVYEPSLVVRYHDIDGNVIYSANTLASEKRTFIESVDVSITDENGNVISETREVPIDSEAFMAIEETLKPHQTFVEWQWWDEENGEFVQWNEFKNTKITRSMDIYPVIYQVEFFDANNPAVNQTDNMIYAFFTEDSQYKLNAAINIPYNQEYLDIYITKLSYDVDNDTQVTLGGVEDIATNVYIKGGTEEYKLASANVITNENGEARHYFYGHLKIEKTYVEAKDKETKDKSVNDYIVIDLMKKLEDGSFEVVSMPITVKDGSGEVNLKLPAGTYYIAEDSWSWRDNIYMAKLRDDMTGVESEFDLDTAIELNILEYKVLKISNIQTEARWFSDSYRKQNVFKKSSRSAGGE